MTDASLILQAAEQGDPQAASQLLPLVYDQLRRMAAQRMAGERQGHSLQATALVHEAYLRLIGNDPNQQWLSRGHFVAAAAEAMRRILVEHARRRKRIRHGGDMQRLPVEVADVPESSSDDRLLALDEALERLGKEDPKLVEIVKLRYFVGLSVGEAAQVMGISERTAKRNWAFARAWLFQQLG